MCKNENENEARRFGPWASFSYYGLFPLFWSKYKILFMQLRDISALFLRKTVPIHKDSYLYLYENNLHDNTWNTSGLRSLRNEKKWFISMSKSNLLRPR